MPKAAAAKVQGAAQAAAMNDEGVKLLEASKRWRADIIGAADNQESPLESMSSAVTGALDGIVTAQMGTLDRSRQAMTTAKKALDGASLATGVANRALEATARTETRMQEGEASTSAKIKELDLRTKNTLTQLQQLELAKTETTILAKGIIAATNGKETQEDLRRALSVVFGQLQVPEVKIEHARRMQRVKGDNMRKPPAMKIKLGSVSDKLRVYEALKRATSQGVPIPYEFSNEVPSYALNSHKSLHKVALELRRIDPQVKTRVSMGKGDNWPVLKMKRRGEAQYKPVTKELMDIARQRIYKNNKAAAAARRAQSEHALLYDAEPQPMEVQQAAQGASGQAAAPGKDTDNPFLSLFSQYK